MSEIRTTTISDLAGTGPVTLTKQSAAKAWIAVLDMSGTPTSGDSFNVSSLIDVTAGAVNPNWTNSFASSNYSHYGSDGNLGMLNSDPNGQTASQGRVYTYNKTFNLIDSIASTSAHGDLA